MGKYGNKITLYKNENYHSKKEAEYAKTLDTLLNGRAVKSWKRQVPYPVYINDKKIFTYYADFVVEWKDGKVTVEDVKGFKTAIYKLKKKAVEAYYDINIIEI